MNKNQPLELALEQLTNPEIIRNSEYRFINQEFGIVLSFAKMDSSLLRIGQPYRVKEGRIMRPLRGKAKIAVNLIEYNIVPGTLVVATPDTIIEPLEISSDFDFQAIVPGNNSFLHPFKEDLIDSYGQQNTIIDLTEKEWDTTGNYFSLLWNIVQEPVFLREIVQHLIIALLQYIRYIQKRNQKSADYQPSHQEELFHRFITLVYEFNKKERNVSFYADKLCLTPRYLNTIIRQVSHHTVMDWINRAIMIEAQILLKHSDLLVFQIADELNFPNPSFFCKFFKRMTGMTPQEYQKK